MTKRKMTITKWIVMFLVGAVFALEFAMVAKQVLGDKAPLRPIAAFVGFRN